MTYTTTLQNEFDQLHDKFELLQAQNIIPAEIGVFIETWANVCTQYPDTDQEIKDNTMLLKHAITFFEEHPFHILEKEVLNQNFLIAVKDLEAITDHLYKEVFVEKTVPVKKIPLSKVITMIEAMPIETRIHAYQMLAHKLAGDFYFRFLLLMQRQIAAEDTLLLLDDRSTYFLVKRWNIIITQLSIQSAKDFEKFFQLTAGLQMMMQVGSKTNPGSWVYDCGIHYLTLLEEINLLKNRQSPVQRKPDDDPETIAVYDNYEIKLGRLYALFTSKHITGTQALLVKSYLEHRPRKTLQDYQDACIEMDQIFEHYVASLPQPRQRRRQPVRKVTSQELAHDTDMVIDNLAKILTTYMDNELITGPEKYLLGFWLANLPIDTEEDRVTILERMQEMIDTLPGHCQQVADNDNFRTSFKNNL